MDEQLCFSQNAIRKFRKIHTANLLIKLQLGRIGTEGVPNWEFEFRVRRLRVIVLRVA